MGYQEIAPTRMIMRVFACSLLISCFTGSLLISCWLKIDNLPLVGFRAMTNLFCSSLLFLVKVIWEFRRKLLDKELISEEILVETTA